MEEHLKQIRQEYLAKVKNSQTLEELDTIFLSLFGKTGKITQLPKEFNKFSTLQLQKLGPIFNQTKEELEQAIEGRREQIKEEAYKNLTKEPFDLSGSGEIKSRQGHLHPITKFEEETAALFGKLGFGQIDAPHIDTDFNNFEVLNIPPEHPARDLWDTFYIDSKRFGIEPGKLLLRTHTSNSQIKIMREFKPPIKLMNIGRCFRYENLDPRHEHTFEQFELVYIDKGVSMAHLQYLSEYFLKAFFGPGIKVRLKPKYYPFVEPGAGVDGLCIFCKGKGCKVCGGEGWLELAGAGMIHPQVLKNGGIDPDVYSGIAWGVGPYRMAMLKYAITDMRFFNSADLRFLEKFE